MAKYRIQSVERCFAILDAIAKLGGASRLGTLQVATGLPLPTVHRFLRVLCASGHVYRTENGTYLLGYAFHQLGPQLGLHQLINRIARRPLREISSHLNVVTNLAFREGLQVVIHERVQTPGSVKFPSDSTPRLDVHSTALGKAMIAFLPERQVDALYNGWPLRSHTGTTINTFAMLKRRLVDVRNSGLAIDEGETFSHIGCVAAPVIDREGRVICSISGSLPVWEVTAGPGRMLGLALTAAAQQISDTLYKTFDDDQLLINQGEDEDE